MVAILAGDLEGVKKSLAQGEYDQPLFSGATNEVIVPLLFAVNSQQTPLIGDLVLNKAIEKRDLDTATYALISGASGLTPNDAGQTPLQQVLAIQHELKKKKPWILRWTRTGWEDVIRELKKKSKVR